MPRTVRSRQSPNYIDGAAVYIEGKKIVGLQQAHVPNAVTNHTVNATFNATEVKGHLDAQGTKINQILAALRTHGLLASS